MRTFLMQALAAAATTTAALAQTTALSPPAERISDRAIQADYASYEALQARLKGLNDRGLGRGPRVADYHLSKAQCWLDVSFHEYTRNDRSAFPQQALEQSERLVVLMEKRSQPLPESMANVEDADRFLPLPDDTPLVNDADRLRPDLWDATARLKGHAGYRCAAQRVACAEVELVHAGNEHRQLGWRHAKPYVQIAEDHVAAAQSAADLCVPPPAPPVPPPPPPPPKPEVRTISAAVLFEFGQSGVDDIRSMTRERLDAAILQARQPNFRIEKVTITGFADRLNGTGQSDFNQRLSLRRAQSVADLLVAAGVDRGLIEVRGKSDSAPVAACAGPFRTTRELEECLAPNRRVEIEIAGLRTP